MKTPILLIAFFVSGSCLAQPATEIILCDFNSNTLELSHPVNITNHPGYDNQPYFHPTEPLLYYSAFDSAGRADIQVYNYETGITTALTQTYDREYSPTLTPDGRYVSCILQRDDGAQDLVKYPVGGGEPVVLIDSLVVGYHAWIDTNQLVLFVLGDPITLRVYDIRNGAQKLIAQHAGRSLHRIPGTTDISFVKKVTDTRWELMWWDPTTAVAIRVVDMLPGREDYAWTPNEKIITSDGKDLYAYDLNDGKRWTKIQGLSMVSAITRIAIHPDGTRVAVVVEE